MKMMMNSDGIITQVKRFEFNGERAKVQRAQSAPTAAMKRLPNDDPARLEVVQNEKLLLMGVRVLLSLCAT